MDTKIYNEYLAAILEKPVQNSTAKPQPDPNGNVLLPITYLNMTYLAFEYAAIVASYSNIGKNVTIMLHDNNIYVHEYFLERIKKMNLTTFNKFFESAIDEFSEILRNFGADMNKVVIVRSSEVWTTVFRHKDEFLNFYRLLSKIPTVENPGSYTKKHVLNVNYTLQAALDIYYGLNSDIFPSTMPQIESIIVESRKCAHYSRILGFLASDYGYRHSLLKPTITVCKEMPYLLENGIPPSEGMSEKEIFILLSNLKLTQKQMAQFNNNYIKPTYKLLSALGIIHKDTRPLCTGDKASLSHDLYLLIDTMEKRIKYITPMQNKTIYIKSFSEFSELRGMLSSELMYRILERCNGERTVSDIANDLHLQISNTSHYINKLRAIGMLSSDKKPRLKALYITLDLTELIHK